jgi:hypothetical protein
VLKEQDKQGKISEAGLEKLVKLENEYRGNHEKLMAAYAHGETVGGKPWEERLRSLTVAQSEYGRNGKGLVTKLHEATSAMKELREEGASVPLMFKKLAQEARAAERGLANFQAQTEGLGPERLPDLGAEGKNHPRSLRQKPSHHKASPNSLRLPAPRRLSLDTSGIASGLTVHVHVENENTLNVDGKSMAENVTRYSKRGAVAK